jgi:NAD+ kinase
VAEWKRIGVVLKTRSEESALVRRVVEIAAAQGLEVVLGPDAEHAIQGLEGCECVVADDVVTGSDLLVVLGGDGTVLRAARALGPRDIPIFGINLGRLGFLASVNPPDVDRVLPAVLGGEHSIQVRPRLAVTRSRDGQPGRTHLVLNDAVISCATNVARMIDLETRIDGHVLGSYRTDGLIISTPTGSTAYSLAAGGSILDPRLAGMIVTPINPQPISHQRPVVISDARSVEVLFVGPRSAHLTLDGQVGLELSPGDAVGVVKSEHPVRFVMERGDDDFATPLRSKLRWDAR